MVAVNRQTQDIEQLAQTKTFLNREFIHWLWFLVEDGGQEFLLNHKKSQDSRVKNFRLWIDDAVALDKASGDSQKIVVKGPRASASEETWVALRKQKYIKEFKFGLEVPDFGEFSGIVSAKDAIPRSLKFTPFGPPTEDPYRHRLHAVEVLLQVFDHLYLTFLEDRSAKIWDNKIKDQRDHWLSSREAKRGYGTAAIRRPHAENPGVAQTSH